ncbi:hypothetical protein ACWDR1_22855 [Streptosporangium sandarakinum]|uniref:hypothetical protein n=1 Tax=Streptosporangium sandarakinum TaxID=1260955 RepID=UPI0033B6314B
MTVKAVRTFVAGANASSGRPSNHPPRLSTGARNRWAALTWLVFTPAPITAAGWPPGSSNARACVTCVVPFPVDSGGFIASRSTRAGNRVGATARTSPNDVQVGQAAAVV